MRFLAGEVAHFAPIPDPEARFRGMSWLTPVIREVMADKAATLHKERFFENAATPNLIGKFDLNVMEDAPVDRFVPRGSRGARTRTGRCSERRDGRHPSREHVPEMEFKVTQGAGETRIAAAGTPP